MEVKAKLKYLRMAPRKVRLVADLIRGKSVQEAQSILNFTIKKAALPLLKLLKTALANAKDTYGLEEPNFYISKISVDEGPKLKRWRPRARGQAFEIQKKTSHITLVLNEIKEITKKVKKIKAKKVELKKPKKLEKKVKPKFRLEKEIKKPDAKQRIKRVFRRKAF